MFKEGSAAWAYAPETSTAGVAVAEGRSSLRDPSPSANHNNLVRAMRSHPVFSCLNTSQFLHALTASRVDDLDAGAVLYERGAQARHFYLVIEGRVHLSLFARSGDEKVVEILGPGKIFGEVGMFCEGGAYPVWAITATKARIARLANDDYLGVLRESPDTCLRMLRHLADRLGRHVQQIECSTLDSATDRLVRMLVARMPPDGDGPADVRLDESRQDLASYLSMKPETLSRALRTLTESGAISVQGRLVHVPSRSRLLLMLEAAQQ